VVLGGDLINPPTGPAGGLVVDDKVLDAPSYRQAAYASVSASSTMESRRGRAPRPAAAKAATVGSGAVPRGHQAARPCALALGHLLRGGANYADNVAE